jgi:hypothetical protein
MLDRAAEIPRHLGLELDICVGTIIGRYTIQYQNLVN